jgi:hypothetical protein
MGNVITIYQWGVQQHGRNYTTHSPYQMKFIIPCFTQKPHYAIACLTIRRVQRIMVQSIIFRKRTLIKRNIIDKVKSGVNKFSPFRDRIGWCGLDWSGSGYVQVKSSCKRGNEPSGSTKCWETTEWLHNFWPLERYSAPQS